MKNAWFIGLIVTVLVISGCADKISSDRTANPLNPTHTNPKYTLPEPQPSTSPKQSIPQPAEGIRDAKIVGLWTYPVYMTFGETSYSSQRYRQFYANGNFIQWSEGSSSITRTEEYTTQIYYNQSSDQRGIWRTDGDNLRLDYDNGKNNVYRYELTQYDADTLGLLLTTEGGSNHFGEKNKHHETTPLKSKIYTAKTTLNNTRTKNNQYQSIR